MLRCCGEVIIESPPPSASTENGGDRCPHKDSGSYQEMGNFCSHDSISARPTASIGNPYKM